MENCGTAAERISLGIKVKINFNKYFLQNYNTSTQFFKVLRKSEKIVTRETILK